MSSARTVFSSGIYAHAPARHIWNLGGKWKTFSSHCGIADGHDGSVKFKVTGDGKLLWESKVVKSGETVFFSVDLSGVDELTLLTEDGGDGSSSDWSLWLEPMLSR